MNNHIVSNTIPDAKYTIPSPPLGNGLIGAGKKKSKSKKGGDIATGITGLAVPFAIYLLGQTVSKDSKDSKTSKTSKDAKSSKDAKTSKKVYKEIFDGPGKGVSRKAAVGGSSKNINEHFNQLNINLDKFLKNA